MDILFLWRRLTPSLVLGGAEVSARLLGARLARRGHRVEFLGSYPTGGDASAVLEQLVQRCRDLGIAARRGAGGALSYTASGIPCRLVPAGALRGELQRRLRARRPDLVFPMALGAAGIQLCHREGAPTVLWVQDLARESWSPLFLEHRAVLYCSEFVRRQCLLLSGVDGRVFYPPFEEPRAPAASARDCITLINDVAVKGSRVCRALAQTFPRRSFLAVESSHRSEIRDARALPNLEIVPGRGDLSEIWGRTRVLLVPSVLVEAFGRVAVEAGLHGIPTIAFDRGGLPEAVGDGGILIREDAIEPWAAAVTELEDEARWSELSRKALRHARGFLGDPADRLMEWGVLPGPVC